MRDIDLLKMWKWAFFFLMLIVTVSTAAADVPFDAYGRLPSLSNVAISPSGSYIALVKTVNEDRMLYVLSLTGSAPKGACKVAEGKLRGIIWADDDHVLMVISTTSGPPMGFTGSKSEYSMLICYDINENKVYNVLTVDKSFHEFVLNSIIGAPSIRRINGETIVFVMGVYVQSHTVPALFKMNLTTGRLKIIEHGTDKSRGWLVDENGEIMGSQTYDTHTKRWIIYVRKDGDMTAAASGEAEIEYPTISGFSPEGDAIWVESAGDSDPTWSPISFKSGIMGVPSLETRDLGGLAVDPYTDRIIGGFPLTGDTGFVFLDPARQKVWKKLKINFPVNMFRLFPLPATIRN